MARKLALLLLLFGLATSCSTDNSDDAGSDDQIGMDDDNPTEDGMEQTDLVGLWVLSDIRIEDGADTITLVLLDQIIDDLVEQECYLISFDFKDDATVDVESRAGDFEIEGVDVVCPEAVESVTANWELDGDQLTITNEVEGSETITIVMEDENTFVIEGEEGIDEEFEGSQAVFVRQ